MRSRVDQTWLPIFFLASEIVDKAGALAEIELICMSASTFLKLELRLACRDAIKLKENKVLTDLARCIQTWSCCWHAREIAFSAVRKEVFFSWSVALVGVVFYTINGLFLFLCKPSSLTRSRAASLTEQHWGIPDATQGRWG